MKLLREHGRELGATAAIRGFGYDQHRLAEDRHPTAADLPTEDQVGAIGPAMLADFVILNDDPLAVATDRLPGVAVDQTWVAGRKAWSLTC